MISDRSSISPPLLFLFSEECGSCLVGVSKVGRTDQVFEAVEEIGTGEKIGGGEGVFGRCDFERARSLGEVREGVGKGREFRGCRGREFECEGDGIGAIFRGG